jgi:hypothetical protein
LLFAIFRERLINDRPELPSFCRKHHLHDRIHLTGLTGWTIRMTENYGFILSSRAPVPSLNQVKHVLERGSILLVTIRQHGGDLTSAPSHGSGIFGKGRADDKESTQTQCTRQSVNQLDRAVANDNLLRMSFPP